MRHKKAKYRLNRFTSWREATIKSMVRNVMTHQSIRTTLNKAKAARPEVEKLITLAKLNDLDARRRAFEVLGDHKLVSLVFKDIGPRFAKIQGGYTRIVSLGKRRGDSAEAVIFELTEIVKKEPKKHKKEKEAKPEETTGAHEPKEKPVDEKKPEHGTVAVKEKPPISQKPTKKFLGGLRGIFKKERDSL